MVNVVNIPEYEAIERRIEQFIVYVGAAMAIGSALRWGIRGALGAVIR